MKEKLVSLEKLEVSISECLNSFVFKKSLRFFKPKYRSLSIFDDMLSKNFRALLNFITESIRHDLLKKEGTLVQLIESIEYS